MWRTKIRDEGELSAHDDAGFLKVCFGEDREHETEDKGKYPIAFHKPELSAILAVNDAAHEGQIPELMQG